MQMKRFILLLNHDDISLSAYLQHCLSRGERFVKASGNTFTFKKAEPSSDRIAVVTYANDDPDLKMKLQLEDYRDLMKKRGWKMICAGKPEDIFDSKRHVFLETDDPEIPFPKTSPDLAEKARKNEVRSCFRCAVMLLLLLGFAIFFIGHDPDVFLSSSHIMIPFAVGIVFWILSLFRLIRGVVTVAKKEQCECGFRNYLAVDSAVLFCLIAVFSLLAALLLDLYLFPDTSKALVFGDQQITVYQDKLPLRLEDLSLPAKGMFRSSRLTERKSFLMSSVYGADQSFSDPKGTSDLSLLSYTVLRSPVPKLLEMASARKGAGLFFSEELTAKWQSSGVNTDGAHRLLAYYPDAVLYLASSADLNEIDPAPVLRILLGK